MYSLMKGLDAEIQEAQHSYSRTNAWTTPSWHIRLKLLRTQNNEQTLKVTIMRGKTHTIHEKLDE